MLVQTFVSLTNLISKGMLLLREYLKHYGK